MTTRIPITIFNGFLGAGKTTIILNLLQQLDVDRISTTPPDNMNDTLNNDANRSTGEVKVQKDKKYSVVWIKNEFGVNEVDSILAQQSSITSVKEITNGCLCCTLVGRLSDSLYEILIDNKIKCDRIIIETSGSAFPTSLVQEINRVSFFNENNPMIILDDAPHLFNELVDGKSEKKDQEYRPPLPVFIDGVICVVDALNYYEYSDTSFTAKIQAKYTDLILLNKHELIGVGEMRQGDGDETIVTKRSKEEQQNEQQGAIDRLKDLLMELNPETPIIKTDYGWINYQVVFGLDSAMWKSEQEHENNKSNPNSEETQQTSPSQPLQNDHATSSGLSDVDVVHVEWITPLHEVNTPSVSLQQPLQQPQSPITLVKFEKFLIQLHLFNCLRAKGIVLLEMTLGQSKFIEKSTQARKIQNQIFHSSNLLSTMVHLPLDSDGTTEPLTSNNLGGVVLGNGDNEELSSRLVTVPVILNWALGRWSLYHVPNYTPLFVSDPQSPVTLINTRLPSVITAPSSLYVSPVNQTQKPSSQTHSRLTLFGASGSINTFSFQKMVARNLPVTIRKECCPPPQNPDKHNHDDNTSCHTNCQNHTTAHHQASSTTPLQNKVDPNNGGFITVLSKDHSHNHQ